MLTEGNIIYFDPFFFKNGNTAKPKYFVVLKKIENSTILGSLPTRKDSIPKKDEVENGCIELPNINLNCFVISSDYEVTDCGKSFDFQTFIYGHEIDDYPVEHFDEIYPIEGANYEIWGKMKSNLFVKLIKCLKTSRAIKRKYRRMLDD